MLVLILGTAWSPSALADIEWDKDDEILTAAKLPPSNLSVVGYMAATHFNYRGNKGSFPQVELGVAATYQLPLGFSVHGALSATDRKEDPAELTTLFVSHTHRLPFIADTGLEVDIRLGRVTNFYGMMNLLRVSPVGRDFILLPQGVYMHDLGDLATYSDGVSVVAHHPNTGVYVEYSNTKTRVRDDWPINENTLIPGRIEGKKGDSWGIRWRGQSSGLYSGAKWVTTNFNSSLADDFSIKLKNAYVGYEGSQWATSYERMTFKTSMSTGAPAVGDSVTLKYMINSGWQVKANYNRYRYTPSAAQAALTDPLKNHSTDFNVGVSYRDINRHLTYRAELHRVRGATWFSHQYSGPKFVDKTTILALQVVYDF